MSQRRLSAYELEKLPLSATGFSNIRKLNLVYVDKTEFIRKLYFGTGPFFLTRPRRFGKSLLISTLESLFTRALADFKDLDIEKADRKAPQARKITQTFPVIRLNFANCADVSNIDEFNRVFLSSLRHSYIRAGLLTNDSTDSFNYLPDEFMDKMLTRSPNSALVMLIDEYDAPITHNLDNEKLLSPIVKTMGRFYSVLKTYQGKFRFIFITGITRTAHVSLFSSFNDLQDLSLDTDFAYILGITEQELHKYFDRYVANAAAVMKLPKAVVYDRLHARYDGFRFTLGSKKTLYNPWSVLSFLKKPHMGFLNYWWMTGGGTPSIMVHYARELARHGKISELTASRRRLEAKKPDIPEKDGITADDININFLSQKSESGRIPLKLLLFQAGIYSLRVTGRKSFIYPNEEVEESLINLVRTIPNLFKDTCFKSAMGSLDSLIDEGDINGIVDEFNAYLDSSLTYNTHVFEHETDVRDVLYAGIVSDCWPVKIRESPNLRGRSDLELITARNAIIIEFKRCESADDEETKLQEGLSQIADRNYGGRKFGRRERRICMVINAGARKITRWQELENAPDGKLSRRAEQSASSG